VAYLDAYVRTDTTTKRCAYSDSHRSTNGDSYFRTHERTDSIPYQIALSKTLSPPNLAADERALGIAQCRTDPFSNCNAYSGTNAFSNSPSDLRPIRLAHCSTIC